MAGEYVRWLARDVKPLQKKELTPEEKRRNWWDYHKWHVVLALVCLVFAADLVSDVVHNARNKPDYKIAYVGSTDLPEDTARALETALAALGEDLNGNGRWSFWSTRSPPAKPRTRRRWSSRRSWPTTTPCCWP